LNVLKLLKALRVPFAVVRTKCDKHVGSEGRSLAAVEAELNSLKQEEKRILETEGLGSTVPAFYISARNYNISRSILGYDRNRDLEGSLFDWADFVLHIMGEGPLEQETC